MTTSKSVTIDIDAILHSKIGDKDRYVPRFLVNYLKKIVHQDECNEILSRHEGLYGLPWITETLKELGMDYVVKGEENLPSPTNGKRYTFVSNHPLGGPDGMIYGKMLAERYDSNIRILVNDLLMNLPGLAPLCVPINKTGKQGRDFPRQVKATFDSSNHVLMFPAGICSRQQDDGSIHDIPWTKTFISKSVGSHRDIVPIHFSGHNSKKFYRLARFSDRFLPFNLAMIFLVDEMYKNVGKEFQVTIGKPIPWQTFDKTKTPAEWAQVVEQRVYDLAPKAQ